MTTRTKIIAKEVCFGLALLVVLVTPFLFGLQNNRYHEDEGIWIYTSQYFKLLFIDRDVHNSQWRVWWAYDQPSLARYIIGLSLYIQGGEERFAEFVGMVGKSVGEGFDWASFDGASRISDMLYVARLPMAILGGVTCVGTYVVGSLLFNRWTGVLAALLLACNPLMLESCQRAMADSPLVFFMVGSILLMILFNRSIIGQRYFSALILSLLIGGSVALATSSKLNGALAGIVFGVNTLLLLFSQIEKMRAADSTVNHTSRVAPIHDVPVVSGSILIGFVASLILFIALNPYLYTRPVRGVQKMIESRMSTVDKQQRRFHGNAIRTVGEKFNFVFSRSLYDKRYTTLRSKSGLPLDFILFLAGFGVLLYSEIRHILNHRSVSPKALALSWIVVTYLGIIAWIPLDWGRYYLPVVPCVAVMCGYGLERFGAAAYSFARRRRSF